MQQAAIRFGMGMLWPQDINKADGVRSWGQKSLELVILDDESDP
jgi:hypothetical protein